MKRAVLFLTVCSLFMSACVQENRFGQREDFDGTRLLSNKRNGFYERNMDTEDYNTNQNPNFVDLKENRLDYGDDENKFREVIVLNSDLQPGAVYITGATARVTAIAPNGISKKEKKRIKRELEEKFVEVTPRYHVHVTIKER